jgi:hypothetical protein
MLTWKNKIWWKENDILYIHPLIAIPSILIISSLFIWGIWGRLL